MRKTKIICTLGPAVKDKAILEQLCLSGMNVARMNFSHGDHDTHLEMMYLLQEVREKVGLPIAAMCDTKGPEIRTGLFEGGKATLEVGQTFTFYGENKLGSASGCSTTYDNLYKVVKPGSRVCIDDGLIELFVEEIQDRDVICTVANGGEVKDHKSVNLPGTPVDMPFLSRQDRSDIPFAAENGFDFIAASFTRSAEDVREIRRLLDSVGRKARRSLQRSKTSRAWTIWMRSFRWPTASWWPGEIWGWKSPPIRCPSSRRRSSGSAAGWAGL